MKNCYDGAGRPLSLLNGETGTDYYAQVASGTDPENTSETIAGYNPFGGMQRLLLQGGAMVQSARYNERGQMTRIGLHRTPTVGTASRLLRLGLDHGPAGENNGNIRAMTVATGQATGNTNPLFSATQTYDYDAVNRLKSTAEGTAWKQTFGYDRFGNRWIEAGPSTCTAGANTCGIDSRGAATGLASYRGETNRLSGVPHDWAGNASPAGLTLTYLLGLDDRGPDISGLGFTQGISAIELPREAACRPRDVMYSGIEPPWPSDSRGPYIKPLDFNLQVERNARILRELNGIPRVY